MSVKYDGAVRRRHLLTSVHSLNWMCCCTKSQWRSSCMMLFAWCWRCSQTFACRWWVSLLRLTPTRVDVIGLHRRHRGRCWNNSRKWRSGRAQVYSQRLIVREWEGSRNRQHSTRSFKRRRKCPSRPAPSSAESDLDRWRDLCWMEGRLDSEASQEKGSIPVQQVERDHPAIHP